MEPAIQLTRLSLALACCAAAAVFAGAAGATSVTSAQVRALAHAAESDPAALARLREVDQVVGRSVDLRRALAGASGRELVRRLRVLEAAAGTPAAPAPRPREDARAILQERRFRRHEAPRPFAGVLTFLSDHVVGPIANALGGRDVLWLALAIAVVLVSGAFASRLAGRRSAVAVSRASARGRGGERLDPRQLEREADEAEGDGDLERAIRLRFRAGLLRLDRARAIELREPVTTGHVARRLRSPDFDRVAASFDEIVYGGREPRAPDVELSREGWRSVLSGAGAR